METHVGFYFKKISERLDKRANESGRSCDVTCSQSRVLWYLRKHLGERVTMREIEQFLDCSHAPVSGLISRLQEKGYVELVRDEKDKRAKIVKPTQKEEQLYQSIKQRQLLREEALLQGFSDEEKQMLSDLLIRVYKNLD